MNKSTPFLHIIDESACVGIDQLVQLIKGQLIEEESHVVVAHIVSCPLCFQSYKGFTDKESNINLISSLNVPDLPNLKPIQKTVIQEQLIGNKSTESAKFIIPKVSKTIPIVKPTYNSLKSLGIACAILVLFGAIWYFKIYKHSMSELFGNMNVVSAPVVDSEKVNDTIKSDTTLAPKAVSPIVKKPKPKPVKDTLKSENAITKGEDAPSKDTVANATVVKDDEAEEPKDDNALFQKGILAYKSNNYTEALSSFSPLVSKKSSDRHFDAIYFSGYCYRYLKNRKKAIEMFTILVKAGAPHHEEAQALITLLKEADNPKANAPAKKPAATTNTPSTTPKN